MKFSTSNLTMNAYFIFMFLPVLFGDSAIANKILLDNDPRRIKSLGRKVHGFTDEVWNANCLQIVKQGNIAKVQ